MDYKVEITYKNIKTIHLRVKNGIVVVSAPYFASKQRIDDFVKKCEKFIEKQLSMEDKKQLSYNDNIEILGDKYHLNQTFIKSYVSGNEIYITNGKNITIEIYRLFADEFLSYMNFVTHKYYDKMTEITKPFPKIIVNNSKSKWGSYSRKTNAITYSYMAMFSSLSGINYLVCHELCHMVYFDHQKGFHDLLDKYMPDNKKFKGELHDGNNID